MVVAEEAETADAETDAEEAAASKGGDAAPASEDEGRIRGFVGAPVTGAIFVSNIAVFAAQVWLTGDWRTVLGVPDAVLRRLGANASLWTIADTRVETLVTSCFLHASIVHLAVNLWILYQVGRHLEAWIGSARFFPLYLASGIAGSAASAIWGRFMGQTMSVGASGAICGLIASAVVLAFRTDGLRSALALRMGALFALLVFTPFIARYWNHETVQIDNAAHAGGALAGVILSVTWRLDVDYGARFTQGVIVACVAFISLAGAVVWVRNATDPYLFMTVEQRVAAASQAFKQGKCARARDAMRRAIAMDPRNFSLQSISTRVDLECTDAQVRDRGGG